MKVAFIVPKDNDQHSPLSQLAQCRVLPPVGLARMAGMVGKNAKVALVDERIESARHDRNASIAVIFINSYNRQRAYDLASQYRKQGSTVVFTGPVLGDALDSAKQHADCLFIGSGEDNMPAFLADYRKNSVKRFYRNNTTTSHTATVYSFADAKLSLAS